MLMIMGTNNKSSIAEAISNYHNSRNYVYSTNIISSLEGHYFNPTEISVTEFCNYMFNDIHDLGEEALPLDIVVIYINYEKLSLDDLGLIEDYANNFETLNMVNTSIVMSDRD